MTAIVTEGYAPFEQYSETGRQGPWTDLYALAAVMYSAIVGRKPPSAAERAAAVVDEDPCLCLAETYTSDYSLNLLLSIDTGLRLNAHARLQSTEEWRRILSGSIPIRPEDTRTPTGFPGADSAPSQTAGPTEPSASPKAGPLPFPIPAWMSRFATNERVFRWFIMSFVLVLGITVVVLLVEQSDLKSQEQATSEALLEVRKEKEVAESKIQRAEETLQTQNAEIERLKITPKATPHSTPHSTRKSH